MTITGNKNNWLNELQEGKGFGVSNGSYCNGLSAAAWIIEGSQLANWLLGSLFTPGHGRDHGSFQSELASIYSLLLTLAYLPQCKQLWPEFHLACDGKSVLQRLKFIGPTDPNKAHADPLLGTWYLLGHCGDTMFLHHVKGHQDRGMHNVLTHNEALNGKAYLIAKRN